MNLRTIKGVTKLLKKAKKCQASANVDLENSKRATCMEEKEEEEHIVMNKNNTVNDLENIMISNDRKLPSREKGIFSEDTNKYRNDAFDIEATSHLESPGVERGLTLKDSHVHLNKIKSQCQLAHPKNAINDNMSEKGFNPASTTFPLGV